MAVTSRAAIDTAGGNRQSPEPKGEFGELLSNLREMELGREAYWGSHPQTSPFRLGRRAATVRHWFHVLPGETILELGAGSGQWTEHLVRELRGQNPIVAAVFDPQLAAQATARALPSVDVRHINDLTRDLRAESFDYVVGTAILCHDRYSENLRAIRRLLKPGGRLLFFEANYWNPQVFAKARIPFVGRLGGHARCQIGMRRYSLLKACSRAGYSEVEIVPYDIIHARTPRRLIGRLQSAAFVLEHAPGVKELCGTLYIAATKPGDGTAKRRIANLATDPRLRGSTSVVIPCRNEEDNVGGLIEDLIGTYGDYLAEIIVVNDGSTDGTSAVARARARDEPRVVVVDRGPPHGVGHALEAGYRVATGQYILSMDCDFRMILPEFRDLFDAVAAGHDGAIGSRFSHASILVNYPFAKIVANRGFHALARLLLRRRMRDISNNLKLYRGDILRELHIARPDFAANVETGLKPLMAGHDIVEVPISWINRTEEMGTSSFRLAKLAPSYAVALAGIVARERRQSKARTTSPSE